DDHGAERRVARAPGPELGVRRELDAEIGRRVEEHPARAVGAHRDRRLGAAGRRALGPGGGAVRAPAVPLRHPAPRGGAEDDHAHDVEDHKTGRVCHSTRHFALAPIPQSDPRPIAQTGSERLSVGIGFVKMPSYLLRNSMALRNGANEIEYLENALWTERLDESFQRDLAANLAELLHSDSIYLTDWAHDQVTVAVYIDVQQFDVDIK